MIDPTDIQPGDRVTNQKHKGKSPDFEVLRVEERETFGGAETVVVIQENALDERDLFERQQQHFEKVEN